MEKSYVIECLNAKNVYFGRFPFMWPGQSYQSFLKGNARVLRTGAGQTGPAHGSEPLSSPAPVGQSAGIRRVVAGKTYARALDFPFKLARNSSFWPARTEKWKVTLKKGKH